ncbi:hypothetical protein, partial [Clostridium sp.]|uniref:hypothetical protein n=1 Tax=Clostridium sp. TaxID=1506 RepID=UPI00258751CE
LSSHTVFSSIFSSIFSSFSSIFDTISIFSNCRYILSLLLFILYVILQSATAVGTGSPSTSYHKFISSNFVYNFDLSSLILAVRFSAMNGVFQPKSKSL